MRETEIEMRIRIQSKRKVRSASSEARNGPLHNTTDDSNTAQRSTVHHPKSVPFNHPQHITSHEVRCYTSGAGLEGHHALERAASIPEWDNLRARDVAASGLGVHDEGNDEAVKTQNFGENENEDHADEQPWLLSGSSDTSVTDDTDGKSSSEPSKTDGKTGAELDEPLVQWHNRIQVGGDEDSYDETVDSNDTSHDDGDDVLHHEVRSKNCHSGDTNTRLGSTVTGTNTCEYDGTCAAHGTEKGSVYGAKVGRHFERRRRGGLTTKKELLGMCKKIGRAHV